MEKGAFPKLDGVASSRAGKFKLCPHPCSVETLEENQIYEKTEELHFVACEILKIMQSLPLGLLLVCVTHSSSFPGSQLFVPICA